MDSSDLTSIPDGAVVVGIDGSAQADNALVWAATEAARRGLPLHLLCAQENQALPAGDLDGRHAWDSIENGAERVLAAATAKVREIAPALAVTSSHPWGGASQILVAASDRAEFIVMGTRGRSRRTAAILGTVSLQTTAHARCPVVVIGAHGGVLPDQAHVVVGVDGSKDSERALRFAFQTAAPHGRVTAMSAWWLEVVDGVVVTTPESEQWATVVGRHEARLHKAIGNLPAEFPDVRLETRVERAHPTEMLLAASRDADLLVVGSRGRGGFAGLMLGSVSQHMLTGAECPVAVVARRGA